MLNIYELKIFLTAAESENFSTAARQLHLTQPAVSQQIQALEQRLGIDLFQRSGRNVSLTAAGHALIPLAREMLALSRRIEETMRSLDGKVIGSLRIGCSTTSGKYILPHLIARYRAVFPGVHVTVEVGSQRGALEKLIDGRVQLAVSSSRVPHKDLVYQEFFTDRVILIAPSEHPWAHRPAIRPEELVGAPFIMREESAGTRQVMIDGLGKHGITLDQLNLVMELGNAEAIEMAVEEGIGMAFVSRLAAQRGIELGRVCAVPVEDMDLKRSIYMAYHAGRANTAAAMAFWDFVHTPDNETLLRLAA